MHRIYLNTYCIRMYTAYGIGYTVYVEDDVSSVISCHSCSSLQDEEVFNAFPEPQ